MKTNFCNKTILKLLQSNPYFRKVTLLCESGIPDIASPAPLFGYV